MKKLVRIDVDVWGGGLTAKEWSITREAGGTVYYEGQQREARFNRFDIGKIYSSRPGTKRIYLISEAEDPAKDRGVRNATWDMLQQIREELSIAERNLLEFEIKG